MDKKLLKIGDSKFDSQVGGNYYYVDKSLLIKDLFDHPAEVTLITRPRSILNILTYGFAFYKKECKIAK